MVESWTERAARQQGIVNEQEIPPRRVQRNLHPEVPVQARIVWERDGEQLVDTIAVAYTARAVLVRLYDTRRPTIAVWLAPEDVRRV